MNKSLQIILAVLAVTAALWISAYWFGEVAQSAPSDPDTAPEVFARISLLIYQPMAAGVLAFGLYTVGAFAALRSWKRFNPGVILVASACLGIALVLTFAWEYTRVYLLP
jgi:hypothetical protein